MTIYTMEQVQEIFGIKKNTLMGMLKTGTLTGFKVAQSWRFTDEDIERCIANLRKDTKFGKTREQQANNKVNFRTNEEE